MTDIPRSAERDAGGAFAGSAARAPEGGGNGAVITATSTAAPTVADDATPDSRRPAWYRDGAVWAHLTPLAGSVLIVTGFGLIPPLLIENTIGRRDEFVRDQAREALGFQLALALVNYAALLTATAPLVWPLALAFGIVLPIVAAVDAAHGRRHRYPLVPRWLD